MESKGTDSLIAGLRCIHEVGYLQTAFSMDKPTYDIFPLGDSALTVDWGNTIDEAINTEVLEWFHRFRNDPLPGMIEAVPAYSSLALHYDISALQEIVPPGKEVYAWMKEQLEQRLEKPLDHEHETRGKIVRIPVCYEPEFASGMEQLTMVTGLSADEVIRIHSTVSYRVYMLGFLPGFAYMGPVDDRIRAPRKPQPVPVAAGSVGIAGNQTGIYPFASPGGWTIIGRTPVQLFDAGKNEPALVQAGDSVQFYSISRHEFTNH
jgi:inhibitor of KinA